MRGVTWTEVKQRATLEGFQPTLPVRGVTRSACLQPPCFRTFQPTLPVRGVTYCNGNVEDPVYISTHTPRAGSDPMLHDHMVKGGFQPTLPVRGVTGYAAALSTARKLFQPTLPVRGVTSKNLSA